jgi:hypothetical protein
MAKESIAALFSSVGVPSEGIFKSHSEARNILMHGGNAESVLRRCKRPLPDLVREIGLIAQAAIIRQLRPPEGEFAVIQDTEFQKLYLTAVAEMEFGGRLGADYPNDDEIPRPDLSVQHTLRPT